MSRILLIVLLFAAFPATAFSIFGVDLLSGDRDQLRTAVKNSGARLIAEAGEAQFFDSYESDGLFPGSSRLYLGFVKADKRIAFVEYEFSGLHRPDLVQAIRAKYGNPRVLTGKFISDQRYQWQQEGVTILLYQDWGASKTRLQYLNPENLQRLKQERQAFLQQSQRAAEPLSDAVY
jgi:hypothetical protein